MKKCFTIIAVVILLAGLSHAQVLFDFSSDQTGSWQVWSDGMATAPTLSWAPDTLGGSSMLAHHIFDGSTGKSNIGFTPPFADLRGKILKMSFYVSQKIVDATDPGLKLYVKYGDGWTWAEAGWVGVWSLKGDAWNTLSFDIPESAEYSNIREVGFEFNQNGALVDTTVDLFIDDVILYNPIVLYDFASDQTGDWRVWSDGMATAPTLSWAPDTLGGSSMMAHHIFDGSTGKSNIGFTPPFADFRGKIIEMSFYVTQAIVDSTDPGLKVYVKHGDSWTWLDGGWVGVWSLKGDDWNKLSLSVPSTSAYSNIREIGFEFNQNGSLVGDTVDIFIDDVIALDVETPPVIDHPIADIMVNMNAADSVLDLSKVFSDPNGDPITYQVESQTNPFLVLTSISDSALTLSFESDATGIDSMVVSATANGKSVMDTFLVSVVQMLFDFTTDQVSSWRVWSDGMAVAPTLSWATDTLGGNSMMAHHIFDGSAGKSNIGFTPDQPDLRSKQISMSFYVSQDIVDASDPGLKVYIKYGDSWTWVDGGWNGAWSLKGDAWNTFTINLTDDANYSNIREIGFEFNQNGALVDTTVDIFVDNVYLLDLKKTPNAIAGENTAAPQQYRLYANYPNPFNPETNIRYDLKEAGKVSLVIYDILGREVATLVKEQQQSTGSHQIVFDAGRFASGMYIYKLEVNGFVAVKKMLLLK